MKKIIKWLVIGFVVLAIIGALGSKGDSSNKQQEVKDAFNQGQQQARETIDSSSFTKEQALKTIQEYQIKDGSNIGDTIVVYYDTRGKIPAIKNLGWFVKETDEMGKYIVGYEQDIEGLPQEPRWEVTKDSIKALNGKAITITPELGPTR